MTTEFCLSDKDWSIFLETDKHRQDVYRAEDVKEAVKLLKLDFDKKFDEFRRTWYSTNNAELAQLRLDVSTLLYGNEGFFEEIDKIFGEKLT